MNNNRHEISRFKIKDGRTAVVRSLTIEDSPLMQEFINEVSKEDTYILLSGEQFSIEQEREFIEKQLSEVERKNGVYLLCFVDGKLVGAFSSLRNIHARTRELHIATLGLIVAKDARHLGIGRKLMTLGIKEAGQAMPGISLLTLGVFADNSVAHRLYGDLGFKEYGRVPGGIKHGNSFVDHILMYRNVG